MKNLLFLFSIILLLSSCDASYPKDEINNLNKQLLTLKQAHSGKLPTAINDSSIAIQNEIEKAQSRFVLFRTYRPAIKRMENLSKMISTGKYSYEAPVVKETENVPSNIRIIEEGKINELMIEYTIVEINGKRYMYSFYRVYSSFTVTPLN
jgi:hypothetical protein